MSRSIVAGNRITFVLGGARSGKSRVAEAIVTVAPPPWTYVATAQAFDGEMRARIDAHRAGRMPGWKTLEAPLDLVGALDTGQPVLVDCLTLWLTNLVLGDHDVDAATASLLASLERRRAAAPRFRASLCRRPVHLQLAQYRQQPHPVPARHGDCG